MSETADVREGRDPLEALGPATLAANLRRVQDHLHDEVVRVQRLLRQLQRYGGHLPVCATVQEPPGWRVGCTCGWDAAFAAAVRDQVQHGQQPEGDEA